MHLCLRSLEMLQILLVEDSPQDREILRYLLDSQFKGNVECSEASSLASAIEVLQKRCVDCVVLDLHLPDSAGKETFHKLYTRFAHIPIIVMTNNKDELLAIEMIQEGAADFVLKNYTDEEDIFRRIVFAIEKHKRSVRVEPAQADSFRRVSSAKHKLAQAQEDGDSPSTIRNIQVETTSAVADLSSKMFSELQKINIQMTRQGTQQEVIAQTVSTLDKELLRGHANRPSMRSQVDLLDHRVTILEDGLTGLQEDVTETGIVAFKENNTMIRTKMSLNVKVIIAVLSLLGVMVTALVGYHALTQKPTESLKTTTTPVSSK